MLKKICSAALSALLLQAAIVPAFAKSSAEKDAERAAKVRAQITKLGTGKDARVKLELRDKTKLEGYLSEVGADSFAVTGIMRLLSIARTASDIDDHIMGSL